MPNWTQPICVARWNQDYAHNGDGVPRVLDVQLDVSGLGQLELCCFCGMPTRSGLYVRIDPSTVPFPVE
jgi:hypothetical protein